MPTNYPSSLDTTTELPAAAGVGANLSTFPHSTMHGNAHDAIRAIEAELGVAPSDTYSTVKARLDQIHLGWTAYTPTFFQGVAITKTVGYGRYMRVGRTVIGAFFLTATSAGTAGQYVEVGLPVACYASAPGNLAFGPCYFTDASPSGNYLGTLGLRNSGAVGLILGNVTISSSGYLGNTVALTIASGDIVSGQFTYEANA